MLVQHVVTCVAIKSVTRIGAVSHCIWRCSILNQLLIKLGSLREIGLEILSRVCIKVERVDHEIPIRMKVNSDLDI